MSQLLIQTYLNHLATLKQVSGTHRETVVREAFKDLLKGWARAHDLTFIPEHEIKTPAKQRRYVDGALLYTLRVPFGYWEAKDSKDNLDEEIIKKFQLGYPKTNIIFEDSTQAVLIQHGQEIMRCPVEDVAGLEKLLKGFFGYKSQEIEAFHTAIEQFKADLPAVLDALRGMIAAAYQQPKFKAAALAFLDQAREAINPNLVDADVREMLIQHILTGEVFAAVFPGTLYHQENNVARELYKLEETFFTGNTKHQMLQGLAPYYTAIRRAASEIATHHQKQAFLKVVYENFYKVYNPKAADRLGVVYTPNEIVRFMIEGADWLCGKHFRRHLIDKQVEILDPATGTGTFICELLEHFRGQPAKLKYKYTEELHANEVAILPYYVANLNIEATYAAIAGEYVEFPNLCFVDTLDNVGEHTAGRNTQADLFGAMTEENVARIRRQNSRKISVIIGNPPYNANQANENENNKNREYPEIDRQIKDTYIAASTAQKTKLYDMYARFFRWASSRLNENGILALVTNRSFIDSRTFDGFRKVVAEEFGEIWVVDLGGDVRSNPKLSGTKHNVFGIQTGVAVSFLVKDTRAQGCRIFYARRPEMETAEDKLAFLGMTKLADIGFDEIRPDAKYNWINQADDNGFESLMSIVPKQSKTQTIFGIYALGISTNRDEWIYDTNTESLAKKMRYFSNAYLTQKEGQDFSSEIKWSRNLKRRFINQQKETFDSNRIVYAAYRPFCRRWLYNSKLFIDESGAKDFSFYNSNGHQKNRSIVFTDPTAQKPFMVLAVENCPDLHFVGAAAGTIVLGKDVFGNGNTEAISNITDWALKQFCQHYAADASLVVPASAGNHSEKPAEAGTTNPRPITKEAIFHYVYAVLHDSIYREKYALNLKREFPRIPLYKNFWQWADWGHTLMDLHIGYETVAPYPIHRTDIPDPKSRSASIPPRCLLKAAPLDGRILIDSETTLAEIPDTAWQYRLGNRSALEWILDQYKEKKPKDPTIRERFDTYRFADYKEKVIDLLTRVATVSVETVAIIEQMRATDR